MSDHKKTREQLIEELLQLRRQVIQLQEVQDERRQVEEALKRLSAEQQIIFDSVPAMIWYKDTQNRILRLNRPAAETMGLLVEEIEGRSVYELNPGEADHYYQDDLEVIDSGTPKIGIIEPLITASGETRWLQTDKVPYLDEQGKIAGVIVFATDITERKRAEQAIQDQHAFLRQVIDIDPNFLFVKDREGRFVLVNQAVAEAYGTTVDDLVGRTDADFNPNPEEVEHFRRDDVEVMDTLQEKFIPEEVITDAAGNLRWLQTVKRPLVDEDGIARQMLGVASDITERKRAEVALQKARENLERRIEERTVELLAANAELEREIAERKAAEIERERLLRDLQRRSTQLQTAARVSHAATGILDSGQLIQQVVDLVQRRFSLYYVGLFLVDRTGEWTGEPGKWAMLRAGSGDAGQQMLSVGHKLEIGGESMIGWCVANQEARIALDVGEEAMRFDNPFLPETRSEMALPLIARGQVVGAMTVQSEEEAAFSDEDVVVLQTMADQVANAIQNARLFDEQQRTASLLGERIRELDCLNDIGRKIDETPSLPEFLHWVTERIPPATRYHDVCAVAIELEGQVYGTAEATTLPCRMVQSLRVGDEVVGRLYLAYREECKFLDRDSVLLGGIAHRVSGYIENRRLIEQTQAALAEVEATHRGYLRGRWQDYLGQRKQETLRQVGSVYEQSATDTAMPAQDAAEPDLWKPEMVRGLVDGRAITADDHGDGEGQANLVAPIVLRGQPIGVLALQDPERTRQWSEEDHALVEAVSRQLALALENARLLEETQRRAAREQLISEVTNRMRETLDIDTVLRTAIREIGDALGLAKVEVRMKGETAQPGN